MDTVVEFEKAWENFRIRLKGKLLEAISGSKLTLSAANKILSHTAKGLTDPYHAEGIWFKNYMGVNPDKAKEISDIVSFSMRFFVEVEEKSFPKTVTYGAPAATGLLGYGTAVAFGAGSVGKIVSVVAPAALTYLTVNKVKKDKKISSETQMVTQYIEQLETYKKEIIEKCN